MGGLSETTALILAGGMGTRLREVVAHTPKVLAEVNGRPFMAYLLDRLVDAGIPMAVICTGYLAEQVSAAFGTCYRGMQLRYSREETPLGTGGAVRLALPLIPSDPLLVMNGDSFCDPDLSLFLERHTAAGAATSLVLARVDNIDRYGAVETDASGAVIRFREKGANSGPGMINAGIYLFSKAALDVIPPERAVSLEHDVFPGLIGKGLYGFHQPSRFIDIGIPSDYHAAAEYLAGSKKDQSE